jgi:prolyl oligopeptidase
MLVLAYGGIGASLGPKFSVDVRAWLELGGAVAVVHVRGGGEYGAAWHKAGAGANKTNSFADLRRALEVLGQSGVPHERIVVRAKSLGGLLTGYAYNVFPQLMGGLISEMPLLAPLETLTSKQGGHMRQELGDPAKDHAAFERIHAYSPIGNLAASKHKPAHLVVCGDKDERVLAGWVYKYVAAAQHVAADDQDVLLLRLEGAGHTQVPAGLARELTVSALTFALRATQGRAA